MAWNGFRSLAQPQRKGALSAKRSLVFPRNDVCSRPLPDIDRNWRRCAAASPKRTLEQLRSVLVRLMAMRDRAALHFLRLNGRIVQFATATKDTIGGTRHSLGSICQLEGPPKWTSHNHRHPKRNPCKSLRISSKPSGLYHETSLDLMEKVHHT